MGEIKNFEGGKEEKRGEKGKKKRKKKEKKKREEGKGKKEENVGFEVPAPVSFRVEKKNEAH